MEDFFDFFAKSHDRWPPPDKSDVENRQGHDGWERGGLTEQIMLQGEALPRGAGRWGRPRSSLTAEGRRRHGGLPVHRPLAGR